MALPQQEILKYIRENKIISKNFEEKSVEPASYDVRLGEIGITSTLKKNINIKEAGLIRIEAGEFAVFQSLEYFDMPLDLVGNIGMKSRYARQGLILLAGLQIDPGFRGPLVLRAFNSSTQAISISYKAPIAMVQFIKLVQPVERPYSGEYQDQKGIPIEDIEQIARTGGMTIGEVILTIQTLVKSVESLEKSVESLEKSQENFRSDWKGHEKRIELIFGLMFTGLTILIGIVAIFAAIK